MWPEKNGRTWRVRESVNGSKIDIATGYRTKSEAEDAIILLKADELRGDRLAHDAGDETVKEWFDTWWPLHKRGLKPSAQRSEDSRVRNHILEDLGHLTLNDLTRDVVQTWVWDMADEIAPKTVRNVHGLLHQALEAAIVDKRIRTNPCKHSKMPELIDREMRFLTEPEAERLVAAIKEEHRPLVLTALGTGLRWGEAAALQVQRVDVLGRALQVAHTLAEVAGAEHGVQLGTPKTRAARRRVTLPQDVVDALIPLVAARTKTAWVFTRKEGDERPLCRQEWYRMIWQPAVSAAGLDGLRFHDLRHTHVAWLISGGVPLTAIQRRLGHTSIRTTSDRYGHLLPAVDDDVMLVLDRALKGKERRGNLGESACQPVLASASESGPVPGQRVSEALTRG